ncbi:protein kinase domain containing protein [Entamoeba histolytica HM-1:IMSS-B]|uniref:Protein kinase domain containing protein n=2 Tax=Entamoeba histolytica (strain ATCC 30459 / HM-1:IMSS / ABRM) TaxID=294381 RepID=C4M957_ENTH1|nr:protein kinase domain containing protein [Entamoeba histolytica HM-1:IMSS]EAL44155.2 protein kinase domain containing protein [Entamoeba histolytica HM-1:IMSS]EMH73474.1 protein kinase domain containing protein [Entamoeba histolytica HM-1:IMSS-B]|eukprot:XP_649541.2 protein kinase domain containing protein [Entamoeba histolytica HM-1:IMSS]
MSLIEQVQLRTTKKELVIVNEERNINNEVNLTFLRYNTTKNPLICVVMKSLIENELTQTIHFRKGFKTIDIIQNSPITCLLNEFIKNERISFETASKIPLFECLMSDIFQFIIKYHSLLPELTIDDFYFSNIHNKTSVFGEFYFLFRLESQTTLYFLSKNQLKECLEKKEYGEWNKETLDYLWKKYVESKKPSSLNCNNLRSFFQSIKRAIELKDMKLKRKTNEKLPLYCDFDLFLARIRKTQKVEEILQDNFIVKCLQRKIPFIIDRKYIQIDDERNEINLQEYYPLIIKKFNDEYIFLKHINKIYKIDAKKYYIGSGGFGIVLKGKYFNTNDWINHACILSTNNPSIKKKCELWKKKILKENKYQQYEDVAIKIFTLKDKNISLKEVKMLTALYDIPCLIKSYGIVHIVTHYQEYYQNNSIDDTFDSIATITKLYNESTLTEYVTNELKNGKKQLKERNIEEMIFMILDIMNGASALGRLDIWHRDHKGDNIFVYKKEGKRRCVIGDIGCARCITKKELYLDIKKTNICSYGRGDTRKDNDIYKVGLCLIDFLMENTRIDEFITNILGMGNEWVIADQLLYERINEYIKQCSIIGCNQKQKEFYELLRRIIQYCISRYNSNQNDSQYRWDIFEEYIEELRIFCKNTFNLEYLSYKNYQQIHSLCITMTMLCYSQEVNIYQQCYHPFHFDSILKLAIQNKYNELFYSPHHFYICVLELIWYVTENKCDNIFISLIMKLLYSIVHDVFPIYFINHPFYYQQASTLQQLLQCLLNEN